MLRASEKGDRHRICPPFCYFPSVWTALFLYTQFRMITVISFPSGTSGWELINTQAASWCNRKSRGATATSTALEGGFYSDSARAYTGYQSLVLFRNVDDCRDISI